MKNKVIVLGVIVSLSSVWAADNTWRAVNSDYNGDYTNTAHWSASRLPAAGDTLLTANGGNLNYTIVFPKGEVTNAANWNLRSGSGSTVTLDGRGCTFSQVASDTAYAQWASGKFDTDINLERNSGGAQLNKVGLWFDDFLCVHSNAYHTILKQGTFDFSRNGGRSTLFTCTYNGQASIRIEPTATLIGAGSFDMRSYCAHALIDVAGGTLRGGTMNHPTGEGNNYSAKASRYVTEVRAREGGQVVFSGTWGIGNSYAHSTNRTFKLSVEDAASSCSMSGLTHTYGRFDLNMLGGTLTVAGNVSLVNETSAVGANGTNFVNLAGGTLVCNSMTAKSTGSAYFTADGGTIRSRTNAGMFLQGFKTATLGAEGLTIDALHTLSVTQSFTNVDGASGKFVKTGDGTLTLAGTDSTFGSCEVRAGMLVVPEAARLRTALTVKNGAEVRLGTANELTGLTLGDATTGGRLTLTAGKTIAVLGPVAFPKAVFALSGTFALDTTNVLLTATGDCAAAKSAWKNCVFSIGAEGGKAYEPIATTDANTGVTRFALAVAAAEIHSKSVTADETATAPVTHSQYDTYDVTVADDATYTIPTSLTTGLLVKKGLGELNVAADLLNLHLGIELRDGTLAFTNVSSAAAAELSVPFRVNKTDAGVTIVRTDADVTLTDMAVTAGAWIKHGTGTLTVLNEGAQTKALTKSNGSVSAEGSLGGGVIRLQPGKAPPASGFSGASVAEGTLHLKGTGTSSVFNLQNSVAVGLVTPDVHEDAQPRLVVDNCLVNTCGPSYHFLFAANMTGANVSRYAGHSPEIVVTNKGVITLDALTTVKNGDSGAIGRPKVTVDDATFFSSYRIYGNLVNSAGMVPTFTIRNKGRLIEKYSTSYPNSARIDAGLYCAGPAVFVVDDALLATAASATSTSYDGVGLYVGGSAADVSFTVTNNAVFWCRYVATGAPLKRLRFTFDKATWEFGSGTNLCVENTAATTVDVRTGGLTVHAKTAQPLRINQPFTGAGTLTKTGSATMWFDARAQWTSGKITPYAADSVTLACDVSVQEGTLAVSPGAASGTNTVTLAAAAALDLRAAAVDNLVLAGAGTVANGTLVAPVFRVDPAGTEPVVTLAADAAVSGAAEVDVGAALPPPYPQALVVAHYTGAAPSVASWKIARHPGSPRLRGAFTAANGVVSVKITHPSTLISVR